MKRGHCVLSRPSQLRRTRGCYTFIFLSLILVLSLGVVSAGWFSDFLGKVTGSATDTNGSDTLNGTAADSSARVCENSCSVNGQCVPVGYRGKGVYCSSDYVLVEQKSADVTCSADFECRDNVCDLEAGTCVSAGFLRKIFNWFSDGDSSSESGELSEGGVFEDGGIAADFNDDGCVGFEDFTSFSQSFGTEDRVFGSSGENGKEYVERRDLNSDGKIDFADFVLFSQAYGEGCSETQPDLSAEYLSSQKAKLSIENICGKTFSELLNPLNPDEETIKSCCGKILEYDRSELEPAAYGSCQGIGGVA